jgi:hypothetical protein
MEATLVSEASAFGREGSTPSSRTERTDMKIAAPVLLILGGYILGLMFHAFGRHKGLGLLVIIAGLVLIGIGLAGNSVTIPKGITVTHPSPSVSQSVTPSPRKT